MRSWRWYSKLGFALVVAAFAWYVWPTQWAYYTVENGSLYLSLWLGKGKITKVGTSFLTEVPSSVIIRVNRFTGRYQILWLRWQDVPKPKKRK